MVNYYQELMIDPELDGEQLVAELRKAQRKWIGRTNAPDLNKRQEAERKVSLVEEAHKILLDEDKKREYDLQLNNSDTPRTESSDYNLNEGNSNVDDLIQESWDLINTGRPADAIIVARRATEVDQSRPEAWGVLAHAHYSWGDLEEAIDGYKRAISIKPNEDVYYHDLGAVLFEYNRVEEAEEYANKAFKLSPEKDYTKLLVGNIASNKGEYDRAIDIFKELLDNNPGNESYKANIAEAYYYKGLSFCFYDNGQNSYCVDEEDTKEMINHMEQANQFYPDPEYDDRIKWGEIALKKKFDKSKWTLFLIPLVMFLSGGGARVLGILIAAGLIYLNMRPQWRLTRIDLFDDKTAYDKVASIVTSTIGALFTATWGAIRGGFRVIFRQ